MKILLIHNAYRQRGGEDTVVEAEHELLERHGHYVERLMFDNEGIRRGLGQLISAAKSVFNRDSYRRTRAMIESFRPDVIHVHNTFYVASPSIYFAAADCGVPVVQTLHNYRLICPSVYLFHEGRVYEDNIRKLFPVGAIMKRVTQGSFVQSLVIAATTAIHKLRGTYRKRISRYIVFTDFARSLFLRSSLGVPTEKFVIKPNFVADPGCDVGHDGEKYLFIGRLTEEKGIRVLMEAARRHEFPLQIIGGGPLEDEIAAAAKELPHVEYLGLTPRERVLELLAEGRALIFPSLWYEGMPMVIIEAMASATPVIASRLGNPERMIEDGVGGLLFQPSNADDLVNCIRQLDHSSALRETLREGARRLYENRYSPDANYQQLIDIYADVSGVSARQATLPDA